MSEQNLAPLDHHFGEHVVVDPSREDGPVAVETFGGRVHVEWDAQAPVTPLGQLPFFIEYLRLGGLFDPWVADCPLVYKSPNAPKTRDVLGTLLLSVLAGHWRYAHISALRADGVNPQLLGMDKVVSEDAVRRALRSIEEEAGLGWLEHHLDYCVGALLHEPWILDVDTTIKPLYGHQQGAEIGYNPHKPGRPSHAYHTYMMGELRLALWVEVQSGKQHASSHAAPGLWALLQRLGRERWPALLRGDVGWSSEANMARAEREGLPYLFRLRLTRNVKRLLERAMAADWEPAGQGWEGKEAELRLKGWSRARRVVVLRRRLPREIVLAERDLAERDLAERDLAERDKDQLQLSFLEIEQGEQRQAYEFAVLVSSLEAEIMTLAQLYRDRADCENNYDELKNHWGWGGFTTRDLKRCRLMAGIVALIYNWWSLFARLADPDHHREAITSRPLLLHAVAKQSHHAGQKRITVSSMHAKAGTAARALRSIASFFAELRKTAEQLTSVERWCRILSRALIKYLKGRVLKPPGRFLPALA